MVNNRPSNDHPNNRSMASEVPNITYFTIRILDKKELHFYAYPFSYIVNGYHLVTFDDFVDRKPKWPETGSCQNDTTKTFKSKMP